jgi:hypothetical protein
VFVCSLDGGQARRGYRNTVRAYMDGISRSCSSLGFSFSGGVEIDRQRASDWSTKSECSADVQGDKRRWRQRRLRPHDSDMRRTLSLTTWRSSWCWLDLLAGGTGDGQQSSARLRGFRRRCYAREIGRQRQIAKKLGHTRELK